MSIDPTNAATAVALDTGYTVTPDQLGPDALMMYLETRLNSLDSQIDGIFKKQKNIESIRKALSQITNALAKLDDDTSTKDLKKSEKDVEVCSGVEKEIENAINQIADIDPALAQKMRTDLRAEGQILYVKDGKYYTREVQATSTYVNSLVKSLESSAQMEMIQLQSMSSARGTAIQMSTNLIASFSEGTKAIVGNLRT